MKMELSAAADGAEQDSRDPASVAWPEGITPGTIITPLMADEMKIELIAAANSAEQWSPYPENVEVTEVITPGTIITPIMAEQGAPYPENVEVTEVITPVTIVTPIIADEMEMELIAAADSAEQVAPYPENAEVTEVITLATVIAPISQEVVAPESDSSEAMLVDNAPMFGEAFTKTESGGRRVLMVFGALLLLAGGGAGLWWYAQKGANEKVAAASDSAAPASGSAALASGSAAPASSGVIAADNKLWELIPDQTGGVADAANALGEADQRMAVINPGGQLALEYRGGKFFGDGQGADLHVYGLEQGGVSYLIFVKNDPAEEWKRIDINGKGFPGGEAGHDMGHHGVRQARQVMIRNDGNADLRIDAVSVKYKDEVQGKGVTPHRH